MVEPSWSRILQIQQEDFIERLKSYFWTEPEAAVVHLSRLDSVEPCYASSACELIRFNLEYEDDLALQNFCEEICEKYENNRHLVDSRMSWKIGKLGEEAVKLFFGNFVGNVDYEVRAGGDGGVDFFWKSNSSIALQVKTKAIGRVYYKDIEEKDFLVDETDFFTSCWVNGHELVEQITWQVNEKDVLANKIIIFVLLFNPIFGDYIQLGSSGTYDFVVAGFLPTNLIRSERSFQLRDFLYCGAMRGYLQACAEAVVS